MTAGTVSRQCNMKAVAQVLHSAARISPSSVSRSFPGFAADVYEAYVLLKFEVRSSDKNECEKS
jgi:hypothetical protein